MILKALTLENFKGIREPVRIEFSPITLLFGPNNAGKSTVLHALIYARELFERGNADPRYTQMGGDTIDLGGFDNLVSGNDRSRRIRMRFEFEVSANELMQRAGKVPHKEGPEAEIDNIFHNESNKEGPTSSLVSEMFPKKTKWDDWHSSIDICPDLLPSTARRILDHNRSRWLEITIGWSEQHQRPLLFSCSTGDSGRDQPTIELNLDEESQVFGVTGLDLGTLVLGKIDTPESRDRRFQLKNFMMDNPDDLVLQQHWAKEISALDDFVRSTPELFRGLIRPEFLTNEGLLKPFPIDYGLTGLPGLTRKISLGCLCYKVGCEADGSRSYGFGGDNGDNGEWKRPWLVTYHLVDPLINAFSSGFIQCCRAFFADSLYLSAIRINPPRHFHPVLPVDPRRWSSGLAAWDLLFEKEAELLGALNAWLNEDDNGFASGFRVEVQHTKQIDVRQSPVAELLTGTENMTLDQVREHLAALPEQRLLRVRNTKTGAKGHPRDIGYGLSQLLPVVVAALDTKSGIVSVEEPESNIHPAFQVVLADLLISQAKANPDALFLIETHSEHLMLRCLRRIRETSAKQLAEGDPSLRPEEIAVHFVEPSEGSPRFHRIRVDEDGEFLDPWPRGFFAERMKEVYGDDL